MPALGAANVRVYDAAGRLVRVLVAGEERDAGRHEVSWDGRDDAGRGVAAGVYFSRINTGGAEASAKMVLLK
ncbi:T9SS type A sorting domain-containing protein, partial [bacterium]|nr:T9SS type A sorting domain-containing protein [bacterium]